jgi:hypothetical protein
VCSVGRSVNDTAHPVNAQIRDILIGRASARPTLV